MQKLERLDSESFITRRIQQGAKESTFDRLHIVSEFDFKRRTISSALDPLFLRDIETYMLDNKDRIDELNDFFEGKIKIVDLPEVIE